MDKDLISKSKLLEWIKTELSKEYPESVAQYVDGRETVLEILSHRLEQGMFDPIPPTIKQGDTIQRKLPGLYLEVSHFAPINLPREEETRDNR